MFKIYDKKQHKCTPFDNPEQSKNQQFIPLHNQRQFTTKRVGKKNKSETSFSLFLSLQHNTDK